MRDKQTEVGRERARERVGRGTTVRETEREGESEREGEGRPSSSVSSFPSGEDVLNHSFVCRHNRAQRRAQGCSVRVSIDCASPSLPTTTTAHHLHLFPLRPPPSPLGPASPRLNLEPRTCPPHLPPAVPTPYRLPPQLPKRGRCAPLHPDYCYLC